MKKLDINQMEQIEGGGGWVAAVACHAGLIGLGALAGGWGAVAGHVAALSLCHVTPAY